MMKPLFEQCKDAALARPMTDVESRLMLKAMLAERIGGIRPSKAADLFKDAEQPIPAFISIFVKRLQLTEDDLEYSEGVVILLVNIATNPAQVVMLAYELVQATLKKGSCVDVSYFGQELVPMGFPTDEMMKESWESQKIAPKSGALNDNWLDTPEAWRG